MRLLARQFLRILVIAAAIGASGVNGYASVLEAFDVHAHGPHGLHDHATLDHDHGQGWDAHAGHDAADPAHSDDEPSSADRACEHLHAHCCSTFAVPAAECGLKLGHLARPAVRGMVSEMPPGEGASSLFRPPRAAA